MVHTVNTLQKKEIKKYNEQNKVENLQALCPTCHRDKCRQENEAAEYIKTVISSTKQSN